MKIFKYFKNIKIVKSVDKFPTRSVPNFKLPIGLLKCYSTRLKYLHKRNTCLIRIGIITSVEDFQNI